MMGPYDHTGKTQGEACGLSADQIARLKALAEKLVMLKKVSMTIASIELETELTERERLLLAFNIGVSKRFQK